jgi:DNA-binding response OmpR family regulator
VRIVIVEDEAITALFLKDTVEQLGFEVLDICNSGDKLFQCIQTNDHIDLVFMDMEIKGPMDGIKCAYHLKDKYNIPVIYITAYADTNTINDAIEVKPLGYIVKPVLASDIEAAIKVAQMQLNLFNKSTPNVIKIATYYLDLENETFYENNQIKKLSKNLKKVALLLFKNQGNTVSDEQISSDIWEKDIDIKKLRDLIYRLRKEFPNLNIINHQNIGYSVS